MSLITRETQDALNFAIAKAMTDPAIPRNAWVELRVHTKITDDGDVLVDGLSLDVVGGPRLVSEHLRRRVAT